MTAFYSLAPDVHDLPRQVPRADHHTWDHAHELPPVMLIPLYVLAVGASAAGLRRLRLVRRRRLGRTSGAPRSLVCRRTNTIVRAMHEVPAWVEAAAAGRGGRAASRSATTTTSSARPAGAHGRARSAPLLPVPTTSGTSTSSTMRLFVQPALRDRPRASGRRATAPSSTGSGPTASPRARRTWRGVLSRLPDRLSLSLRLRRC